VKIIHNGRVVWLPADEVQSILDESEDEKKADASFKANLEKALHGASRALAEEVRVLLYLTIETLSQRVEDRTVSDSEAERLTRNLRRRFEEAEENIASLLRIDDELTALKRADPILTGYERKMAEMLRLQESGQMAEASALAKELMRDKRQYLLRGRALEPLANAAYYRRLELQKGKGRVLNVQQHLCEMRDAVVREALRRIRESLGAPDDDLLEDSTEVSVISDTDRAQSVLKYQRELKQLRLQMKTIVKTIKEIDSICNWIESEIFPDSEVKKAAAEYIKTRKEPGVAPVEEKTGEKPGRSQRMAVVFRLKEKGKLKRDTTS